MALLLIDEVHLLNESRGAALEAGVVSRIKMISSLRAMSEVGSTCPVLSLLCLGHAAAITQLAATGCLYCPGQSRCLIFSILPLT